MVNTSQRALPSEAFDGFAALFIAAVISTRFGYPELGWEGLWSLRLTIVDCLFGFVFVLAWRYCFTVLKLYDKFATVRSRMGATLKGVLVMVLPFFVFLYFEHPHIITRRGIFFSVLALFCYEVNRISLSNYLLDRLAARNPRRALIVGSGRRAAKAWRAIRTRYPHSIQLAGFVDNRDTDEMAPDVARRYLGQVKDLSEIFPAPVRRCGADCNANSLVLPTDAGGCDDCRTCGRHDRLSRRHLFVESSWVRSKQMDIPGACFKSGRVSVYPRGKALSRRSLCKPCTSIVHSSPALVGADAAADRGAGH